MKKKVLLVLLFLLLFFITRVYKINEAPPSLYWDEASITYNAYSVVTTGYDEWGDFLPLHFRAFGEFKLPVFIYASGILGKFINFPDWTVRLTAVLFSSGIIIAVYLLTLNIFKNYLISLLALLILITTPGFFLFSRVGYEATAGLMFFLFGVLCFLKSFEKKYLLVVSVILFLLSAYSYNSFRIILPLIIPILTLYFIVNHKKSPQNLIINISSLFIFIIGLLPIFRFYSLADGLHRFNTVGIFNHYDSLKDILITFIKNYLLHFSPSFLFIKGDSNLRIHSGEFGEFFWLILPLFLLGVYYIFKKGALSSKLLLILLLISPIPAAITIESPHILRSNLMLPIISIISAVGLLNFHTKVVKYITIILFFALLTFFSFYLFAFFNTYNSTSSEQWQYGYKKIFVDYKNQFSKYDNIIISDYLAQPYIFTLYYLKYDPDKFRSEVEYNPPDKWGFSTVSKFDKFIFMPIEDVSLPRGRNLVFSSSQEQLEGYSYSSIIYNLDNKPAFYVYEYSK